MLDAFVIDELRRREREQEQLEKDGGRARLEFPIDDEYGTDEEPYKDKGEGDSGKSIIVIEL